MKTHCHRFHLIFWVLILSTGIAFPQEWNSYPYVNDKKIIEFGWEYLKSGYYERNIENARVF